MKKAISCACALIVATSAVVALSSAAGAVATAVDLDCVVSAPVVGDQPADQSIILDATAPSSVPPGGAFPVVVSASPLSIPGSFSAGGYTVTINNATNISLELPVPANASFTSASLSGGSGLGAGAPTVALVGTDVVLSVPGPIPGGTSFTLPTVTMNLVASAATGSAIEPQVGGTTTADPGYQMTVNAAIPVLGNQDVPLKCAPKAPNPALSSTTIGNVGALGDVNPPTVTLTAPPHGAVYGVGQVVNAAFSCADTVAVQSCVGTVASGAPINTATAGAKTFTVTATDTAGNPTTVTNSYYVINSTPTTLGPTQVATLTASGSSAVAGAAARVKVQAPAPNGGQVRVGDTITIDWALSRAALTGFLDYGNDGPDPVNWTLPAPTNTTINGAVLTDELGLNGETRAYAHEGTAATGLKTITPSANPVGATQLAIAWDDNSSPTGFLFFGQKGDGLLIHVRFTATVTAPGPVQIQGFPALTGTDSGSFTSSAVTAAQVNIAYTAIDVTPPTISIASPTHGGVVNQGQALAASYSCSDNVGVPTCVGPVANGASLDTSTLGVKQFAVTSVDGGGITATKTITYTVVDPTFSETPTVSASDCEGTEAGTCAFTVSLSNVYGQPVTVDYATEPGTADASDYTDGSGTLTFATGETSKPVNVALTDDALDEPNESFTLALSNPTNAALGTNGTGTIVDGSVTYTANYDTATGATLEAAATYYGIPVADITKTGGTLIAFLTGLSGGPAGPLAPPANTGPVSITATYRQADAPAVDALAASYGLNGDEIHWYGGYILGFFYLLSQ